jgi:hypothetical protein
MKRTRTISEVISSLFILDVFLDIFMSDWEEIWVRLNSIDDNSLFD